MSIRTKIIFSHAILLLAVLFASVVIVKALTLSQQNRQEVEATYAQLRNINLVFAEVNDFQEQIAESFILRDQSTGVDEARDALLQRLAIHRELVDDADVQDISESAREAERASIFTLENLIREVDETRRELDVLLAAGERETAERLYEERIEHRFDIAIDALLEQSMARDRRALDAVLDDSDRLARRSITLSITLVLAVGAIGLGNVLVMNRTILRPIATLETAADAVGHGDLNYFVEQQSNDELGNLARRFNHMTRQVREERDAHLRAKATLSREVEARTADLRQRTDELEASNERLREVDASRANFFADISHELRTPLTVLRGQAEVALRQTALDPEETRATLRAVVRKAGQMARLVDDLLFLARSESGSIGVEFDDVVLQEVIADVLIDGEGLSHREDIRIAPNQPAKPVIVRGDGERLRQAVMIALDNAIKIAPAGTTVSVDLYRDGARGVIRVRDEGPGFTEEELGSAFTRFYRGRPSRGRTGRGLGLGLSIAKWILDQHAGTIRIDSVPDGGATVEISLPVVEEAA